MYVQVSHTYIRMSSLSHTYIPTPPSSPTYTHFPHLSQTISSKLHPFHHHTPPHLHVCNGLDLCVALGCSLELVHQLLDVESNLTKVQIHVLINHTPYQILTLFCTRHIIIEYHISAHGSSSHSVPKINGYLTYTNSKIHSPWHINLHTGLHIG